MAFAQRAICCRLFFDIVMATAFDVTTMPIHNCFWTSTFLSACLASSSTLEFSMFYAICQSQKKSWWEASTLRTQNLSLQGWCALGYCRLTMCRDVVSLAMLLPRAVYSRCLETNLELMSLGEVKKYLCFMNPQQIKLLKCYKTAS